MNETMGYIKYGMVGAILSGLSLGWGDLGKALLLGFAGAVGGLLARMFTNWLKRKWKIFRTK